MNVFVALKRSLEKSILLKRSIRNETSYIHVSNRTKSRADLFAFLVRDEVLGELMSHISFDVFCESINKMREMGLHYSRSGDYIPIASLCFKPSLQLCVSYFAKNEITLFEFIQEITAYFGASSEQFAKKYLIDIFKSKLWQLANMQAIKIRPNCVTITAALLFILTDVAYLSKNNTIRQRMSKQIFCYLDTKLTQDELQIFDIACDLMGAVVRGEINPRGDWCFYKNSEKSLLPRLILCYGDFLCYPDNLQNYTDTMLHILSAQESADFYESQDDIYDLIYEYFSEVLDFAEKINFIV